MMDTGCPGAEEAARGVDDRKGVDVESMCAFFEGDDTFQEGGVSSDGHEAEPALTFFVPVADTKHAVRVPVCRRHCDELGAIYGEGTS